MWTHLRVRRRLTEAIAPAGTVSYQPMEVLHDGRVTRASDVYSFGMIMLEMFTGVPVFEGYSSSQVRSLLLNRLLRPCKHSTGPSCCSQGCPSKHAGVHLQHRPPSYAGSCAHLVPGP